MLTLDSDTQGWKARKRVGNVNDQVENCIASAMSSSTITYTICYDLEPRVREEGSESGPREDMITTWSLDA